MACWIFPDAPFGNKKFMKNRRIILQWTGAVIFDKWTLSLSLTGHTRQIHIIIRRSRWLAVHRLHIDQTAQSSSLTW